MDMSLISIDSASNILEYAGAFNPAIVVRNEELILLKGNRQSVGNSMDLGLFKSQKMKLKPGDMIYLFSDGYQDQFGGDRGKKFMTKNLKQLFVRIAHMDTNKQLKVLQDSLNKWKGNFEQVDDILVIGILFN
jgi:serine phosphatase RsbU (regulator of sigma subunit)